MSLGRPAQVRVAAGAMLGLGAGVVAWTVAEAVLLEQASLLRIVPDGLGWLARVDSLVAASLGVYLGMATGAVEGLLARQRPLAARGLCVGLVAGPIGAWAGLFLGQQAMMILGPTYAARALAWSLFGLFLGVAPALARRAPEQALRAAIGGAIGGALGGLAFNLVVDRIAQISLYGRMVGLPIVATTLGASFGLAETLLRTSWITVLSGKAEGYELSLGRRPVTVGGAATADLVLTTDPPLPTEALRLSPTPDGYRLTADKESGVKVGQTPVTDRVLRDGDVVRVGGLRLLFQETVDRPAAKQETLTHDGRGSDREGAALPATMAPGAAKAPIPAPSAWLESEHESTRGRRWVLDRDVITVGRDDDNSIIIDDLSVSLHHARVERKGKLWVVYDLGSSNGTSVQGRPTSENALKDGFEVQFGQVKLRFVQT